MKLILLELNEINFDAVSFYNERGEYLPGFEKLFEKGITDTESEPEYKNLEPWVQWPSVHTGKTYDEHKVFRLGDFVNSTDEQFFEQVEKAGFSVGAVSPMNATNKLQNPAYFIPDPWTQTPCDNSFFSRSITDAIVQAVNDPSDKNYDALMFAGMLAGIGFGNAGCHLPHGMSYAVAGLVKDYKPKGWPSDHPMVPHGISVIVNSPAVFRKTGPACPERHWEAADAMGADLNNKNIEDGGEILAEQIISMMRDTGIPNGLSGVGYSMGDLDELTDRSFAQKRLIDNGPLPIERNDLKELFHDAMSYW